MLQVPFTSQINRHTSRFLFWGLLLGNPDEDSPILVYRIKRVQNERIRGNLSGAADRVSRWLMADTGSILLACCVRGENSGSFVQPQLWDAASAGWKECGLSREGTPGLESRSDHMHVGGPYQKLCSASACSHLGKYTYCARS